MRQKDSIVLPRTDVGNLLRLLGFFVNGDADAHGVRDELDATKQAKELIILFRMRGL